MGSLKSTNLGPDRDHSSGGIRDPFIEHWSAGVQRGLRHKLILEVHYAGRLDETCFGPTKHLPEAPARRILHAVNFGRRLCSQVNRSAAGNGLQINPLRRLDPNFGALRVWEKRPIRVIAACRPP